MEEDALKTRYTRELERQVRKLEAENRALVNTIFGTRGFAPPFSEEFVQQLKVPEEVKAAVVYPGPENKPVFKSARKFRNWMERQTILRKRAAVKPS